MLGCPRIPPGEHRRIAAAVARAADSFTRSDLVGRSAAELLAAVDDGSAAFAVVRQRLEGSAGMPLQHVAAQDIVGDFGIGESTCLRIDGSNERPARPMADALPDVRTAQPVREIVTTDRGVEVDTNGDRLTAGAAVVVVPPPVVTRIRFVPALGTNLPRALGRLRMGAAAKIVAPTESTPPLLALQSGDAT